MANSILEEEKNTLFTRLYWFPLFSFEENVNLVFFRHFDISAKKRCFASDVQNIVLQQAINWYGFTYSR